jgi:hypothetical protein
VAGHEHRISDYRHPRSRAVQPDFASARLRIARVSRESRAVTLEVQSSKRHAKSASNAGGNGTILRPEERVYV